MIFDSISGFNGAFGIFGIFSIITLIFFVGILAATIFLFSRIAKQRKKNNNSPKLTVDAVIVSKHPHVSGGHGDHIAHTTYYVTFQVESGDRMQLIVSSYDYGMLVEGDRGKLTFQGTRFLSFARQ